MYIGYNDGYEGGKSAIGGVGKDKTYSTIYIGKNVSLPCRGILAHEYTHTIVIVQIAPNEEVHTCLIITK